MARAFGVSYKGSKNRIGEKLLEQIPPADIFVDLFAGGCAMSHIALLSGKYKKVIANDINKTPELFLKAINGGFKNECRWISREEFHRLKATDMYIACVWSFGNNLTWYLYGEHLEPYKKAYHYAKVFGDFSLFNEFAPYIEQEYNGNLRKCIKDNYERLKQDYTKWFYSQLGYSRDETESLLNATQADYDAETEKIRQYLRSALNQSGKTQADIGKYLGSHMAKHYFAKSQWELPTQEAYEKLQEILPLDINYKDLSRKINAIRTQLQNLQNLQSLQKLENLEGLRRLQNLQSLQKLERLESPETLQSLEGLEYRADKLSISQSCYKDFELPKADECVIYCDIPYLNTDKYHHGGKELEFNHDEFYKWCREKASQGYKIYISEYQMPNDFKVAFELERLSVYGRKPNKVVEKLFTL